MTTVTIYYTDGTEKTITISEKEEAYYDNLPFTDPKVLRTWLR